MPKFRGFGVEVTFYNGDGNRPTPGESEFRGSHEVLSGVESDGFERARELLVQLNDMTTGVSPDGLTRGDAEMEHEKELGRQFLNTVRGIAEARSSKRLLNSMVTLVGQVGDIPEMMNTMQRMIQEETLSENSDTHYLLDKFAKYVSSRLPREPQHGDLDAWTEWDKKRNPDKYKPKPREECRKFLGLF